MAAKKKKQNKLTQKNNGSCQSSPERKDSASRVVEQAVQEYLPKFDTAREKYDWELLELCAEIREKYCNKASHILEDIAIRQGLNPRYYKDRLKILDRSGRILHEKLHTGVQDISPAILYELDCCMAKEHNDIREEVLKKVIKDNITKQQAVDLRDRLLRNKKLKEKELGKEPETEIIWGKDIVTIVPDKCRLIHGDFVEKASQIKNGSVDAIITDPPYEKKYEPLYKELALFARDKLKKYGNLIVMTGHHNLPEVLALMTPFIPYKWELAYVMTGNKKASMFTPRVKVGWKPIIWFQNEIYTGKDTDWVSDVIWTDGSDRDKRFHKWGQGVGGFIQIVESFTEPGDLVVDPFLGGGTTGAACLRTGRDFIGIEINKESFETSAKRLRQEYQDLEEGGDRDGC